MVNVVYRRIVVLVLSIMTISLCSYPFVAYASSSLTADEVSQFVDTDEARQQALAMLRASDFANDTSSAPDAASDIILSRPAKVHYINYYDNGMKVEDFADVTEFQWVAAVYVNGTPVGTVRLFNHDGEPAIGDYGQNVEEATLLPKQSESVLVFDVKTKAYYLADNGRLRSLNDQARRYLDQGQPLPQITEEPLTRSAGEQALVGGRSSAKGASSPEETNDSNAVQWPAVMAIAVTALGLLGAALLVSRRGASHRD